MYAIMNKYNECVGIIGNYKGAVREAKKLKAKCIKKVDVSAVDATVKKSVWRNRRANMVINRIVGILAMILAVLIGIVGYQTGEALDAALFIGFLGIAVFFHKGKIIV